MKACLLTLTVLAVVPFADAQVVIVHPNQYATVEGPTANSYPFRFSNVAGHYQQSFDAAQFSGQITISEVSFRYFGDAPIPAATVDFKMRLAYCANPWNSLNSTFANNIGGSSTVVWDGVWNIPAFNGDPASPNPFTSRVFLTTPFNYDPAQGDLLMDIEMRQSTYGTGTGFAGIFERSDTSVGTHRVYANSGNPLSASGTLGTYGLIVEFTGSTGITPYGTGCAGAGGFVPTLGMTGSPAGGQPVTLTLDKGLGGVWSATLISIGQANMPLGGGCTLLVATTPFSFLIPLGGSGPGGGSFNLSTPIPVGTPAGTIYLQSFVDDPAGPIGLSVTNGLKVDIQ